MPFYFKRKYLFITITKTKYDDIITIKYYLNNTTLIKFSLPKLNNNVIIIMTKLNNNVIIIMTNIYIFDFITL